MPTPAVPTTAPPRNCLRSIACPRSSSVSLESSEQTLRVAESPDDKIIHLDPRAALEADQQKLEKLHEQIAPLQSEINQLNRQFWVSKDKVKANKYDLSASRYRQIEQDEVYYEKAAVTLQRLQQLEEAMGAATDELLSMIGEP